MTYTSYTCKSYGDPYCLVHGRLHPNNADWTHDVNGRAVTYRLENEMAGWSWRKMSEMRSKGKS